MRCGLAFFLLSLLGGCAGRWSVPASSEGIEPADTSRAGELPAVEDRALRQLAQEESRPTTRWTEPVVHVPRDWKSLPQGAVRWSLQSPLAARRMRGVRALGEGRIALDLGYEWRVVDARSGRELWRRPTVDGEPCWDATGHGLFVLAGRRAVEARDAATGEVRWALGGTHGLVSFELRGEPLFVDDAFLMILELPASEPEWPLRGRRGSRRQLLRVDAATGRHRASRCRHECTLVRRRDGRVSWVDGEVRAVMGRPEGWPSDAQLAYEPPHLVAQDARKRERWRFPVNLDHFPLGGSLPPVLGPAHLVLPSESRREVAIVDLATGRHWTVRELPGWALGVWVAGDTLVVAHDYRFVTALALDEETLAPREVLSLEDDLRGSIAMLIHGRRPRHPGLAATLRHPSSREQAAAWITHMRESAAPLLAEALGEAEPRAAGAALWALRGQVDPGDAGRHLLLSLIRRACEGAPPVETLPLLAAVADAWDHGTLDANTARGLARHLGRLLDANTWAARGGAFDRARAFLERAAPTNEALRVWHDALEAKAGEARGPCPDGLSPPRLAALRRWFTYASHEVGPSEGDACRGVATPNGWVSARSLAAANQGLRKDETFELDHPAFGPVPAIRYRSRYVDAAQEPCSLRILVAEVRDEWRVLESSPSCGSISD